MNATPAELQEIMQCYTAAHKLRGWPAHWFVLNVIGLVKNHCTAVATDAPLTQQRLNLEYSRLRDFATIEGSHLWRPLGLSFQKHLRLLNNALDFTLLATVGNTFMLRPAPLIGNIASINGQTAAVTTEWEELAGRLASPGHARQHRVEYIPPELRPHFAPARPQPAPPPGKLAR